MHIKDPRGEGLLPKISVAPKGMLFETLWSENGYRLFGHFLIGYGFRGNYRSV